MQFKDVFDKLLSESEGEVTVKEAIAKSITDKATGGDINAVKFLRDMVDDDKKDEPVEIKITIVD